MGRLTEVLALNALSAVQGDRCALELLAELAGFGVEVGIDDSLLVNGQGQHVATVCLHENGLDYTVRF